MALDPLVELVAGPEMAGRLIPPGLPGSVSRFNPDRLRHHEYQLVRLLLDGQTAKLLDLLAGGRRGEGLHPLALEGGAPAVLPGHDVAALFAARLAEMLLPRVALAPYEPQAKAFELERRELLEGKRVRAARQAGFGSGGHGMVMK